MLYNIKRENHHMANLLSVSLEMIVECPFISHCYIKSFSFSVSKL